jgi:hypothetical protein
MGFKLKIEGVETIQLDLASINSVKFETNIPVDSNARSGDVGTTLVVIGKILAAVNGGNADDTMKLAKWSLVSAEKADCYRRATLEVHAADQMVRCYTFPNAFAVDYSESYDDAEGVGTFQLVIKQKKDKLPDVKIEGGYKS